MMEDLDLCMHETAYSHSSYSPACKHSCTSPWTEFHTLEYISVHSDSSTSVTPVKSNLFPNLHSSLVQNVVPFREAASVKETALTQCL
jgi:hypothetical protein